MVLWTVQLTVCSVFWMSLVLAHSSSNTSSSRKSRFFPFYTLGRFESTDCVGANNMVGTCVLKGECSDNGGIAAGSCSTITKQAVCCIYQKTCGGSSSYVNTYFYNPSYPASWGGGTAGCGITINPSADDICQLRVDFLDFSVAQPNGDGVCVTDYVSISGGSSRVPNICGENTGQHVYVDFDGTNSISVSVSATPTYTFNRHFHFRLTQISCSAANRAPSGCLQYHTDTTGTVRSFNYNSGPNSRLNSIGVEGSRQLASTAYGICVKVSPNRCTITWSQTGSDPYSFTVTGDVDVVEFGFLGTRLVQEQDCTTDFIVIPNAMQGGRTMPSDRFCGLGLVATTSNAQPFVIYAVNDGNEDKDISNRGFSLSYSQTYCSVV